MGFIFRWRPRLWCHLFYFFVLFTLTTQQDLATQANAVDVDGEKKLYFKIGPIRNGAQKAILDEVEPVFGRINEPLETNDLGAYDDNILEDINRESAIFVPSLYINETRDIGQATKTAPTRPPTTKPPRTTPLPSTEPPTTTLPPPPPTPEITRPPPLPETSRPVQPPQPFRNIPQQPIRPPQQPFQPPQQQQFQQVQHPFQPHQPQFQQFPQPQQPHFPPQQPRFPQQQPPFQQQQQFRPQFPPQQPPQPFRQPFQPQQQTFRPPQTFQQFQTPAPHFQQITRSPQQQFHFVPQQQQFQTLPQTTTTRAPPSPLPSQFPTTRGPFRPLRPFRPQPSFNRPRPNDPTGLRTGVCPETIFYEAAPASVFELQQFYSHFAVVVSVDQCARTCHEFNCAAAFYDPRDGHCQFNPSSVSQVPQGACPNWPNPLYRNNVARGSIPLKIFCVTCQRRRRPLGRGRGRRPRIQRPKNLRFEPTVIGRSALNAVHGVVLRQPQAISIGFGPSTSREDWFMGSRSREKSKESLERFDSAEQKTIDLRSSSERFRKLSQKSSKSSSGEHHAQSGEYKIPASAFSRNSKSSAGRIDVNSWPVSRFTKSQETRISKGQQMMEPSDVHEEDQDGSWGSDGSNTETRIHSLTSQEFKARYLQRGVPISRQRLPHSEVIAGSLSDLSESS